MLQWSLANLLAWAAQVAAVVAIGLLTPVLLGMRAPGARLVFLRVLLVGCVLLPVLQPWAVRPAPAPAALELAPADLMAPATGSPVALSLPDVATGSTSRLASSQWPSWPAIAIGVLAAGVVVRLGWLGLGLLSLMRLRRSSTAIAPPPASVQDAALVVGATASFRISSRVQRPVTFGVRQPVVLVPEGFLAFTPAEQSAIACHELLHVRRRDWLRTLAEEVVCAVLWFHPAIWWLVDQIHLAAEQVIDRHAVRLLGDRRAYLQALLRLAATGPEPRLQPAALFLKHGHLRQGWECSSRRRPCHTFVSLRHLRSSSRCWPAVACGPCRRFR
jgi:beta-lactamase regulating signal transducer with metallopeptidase domain